MKDFVVKNNKILLTGVLALTLIIGGTYAWLSLTVNSNTVNVLNADTCH